MEENKREIHWILTVRTNEWNNGINKSTVTGTLFHSKNNAELAAKKMRCEYIISKVSTVNQFLNKDFTKESIKKLLDENLEKTYEFYWLVNNPIVEVYPGVNFKGEYPHQLMISSIEFAD